MSEAAGVVVLNINGDELPPPSGPGDIARALDHAPLDGDWCLYLTLPNEDVLDASLERAGAPFEVGIEMGREYWMATSTVDRALLEQILASFLEGSERWRDLATWKQPPPPDPKVVAQAMRKDRYKLLLLLVPALAIGLGAFGKGAWAGALVLLALPVALTVAIVLKLRAVKAASTWSRATARITRSELRTETRTDSDSGAVTKLEHPLVEYEFGIGFDKYRGQRISIGEIMPNTPEVHEVLRRYPVGGSATAYYDPKNPAVSVLERELPKGFQAIWVLVAGVYAACFAGAWWLVTR